MQPPAPANDRKGFRIPRHPLEDPHVRIHAFASEIRLGPILLDLVRLPRDRFASTRVPALRKAIDFRLGKILEEKYSSAACDLCINDPYPKRFRCQGNKAEDQGIGQVTTQPPHHRAIHPRGGPRWRAPGRKSVREPVLPLPKSARGIRLPQEFAGSAKTHRSSRSRTAPYLVSPLQRPCRIRE